jgi:hypothetical protein
VSEEELQKIREPWEQVSTPPRYLDAEDYRERALDALDELRDLVPKLFEEIYRLRQLEDEAEEERHRGSARIDWFVARSAA